jgi:flagellar hook-basal body complex protein FliE
MAEMDINRVLSELRALSTRSQPTLAPPAEAPSGSRGFGEVMSQAVKQVNATQNGAARAAEDFQLGRGDLATTMLKLQQSSVEFRAAVEVRNRAVSAYQDIMNMPV